MSLKYASERARWSAVQARQRSADGTFVYAVQTTGIYCRPICPSRRPRREHVQFFTEPHEAEKAGFRACQRCHPNGQSPRESEAARIVQSCEMLARSDELMRVHQVAHAVGMTSAHFSRRFTALVGISPKQYAEARRRERVRNSIGTSATVTEAIYESGYGSNGRFYANSTETLGMKPSAFKKGGRGESIRFTVENSPLGYVLIAATDAGICSIILGDSGKALEHELREQFPGAELTNAGEGFKKVVKQVLRYIKEPALGLDLPLDIRGTAFQRRVWDALCKIPCGTTSTYSRIAQDLGMPKSVRAVARAIASNKVALAVPCHRVIRASGDLCGYRWGPERKAKLLQAERSGR